MPEYGPRRTHSELDPFKTYLEERTRPGMWNAQVPWRQLRERRCTGDTRSEGLATPTELSTCRGGRTVVSLRLKKSPRKKLDSSSLLFSVPLPLLRPVPCVGLKKQRDDLDRARAALEGVDPTVVKSARPSAVAELMNADGPSEEGRYCVDPEAYQEGCVAYDAVSGMLPLSSSSFPRHGPIRCFPERRNDSSKDQTCEQ